MGARGAGEGTASAAAPEDLLAQHARRFEQRFGRGAGVRVCFAPGRVNLQGAHLDYNGGPVMPMAIDRGTFVALRPRADRRVRLATAAEEPVRELDLDALPRARSGHWSDYPCGVLVRLAGRVGQGAGETCGLDVLFGGNLPVGAGLSSSASICVATAFALDAAWDLGLAPLERVRVALAAEREFVGVQCGAMDPYAVGLARTGHLLWLDCKDLTWTHLPLDHRAVRVVVADTLVRRELARGEFNLRVDQARAAYEALRPHASGATCLRDVPLEVLERHGGELAPLLRRRAEHVVREVARTFEARAALERGDLAGFGARMTRSHASLRDLYEVSVPELDCLVEAATSEPGVLGARLTGAGFGGCVVALADARAESSGALERIAESFARRFGRRPALEVFGGDEGPRELRGPWA